MVFDNNDEFENHLERETFKQILKQDKQFIIKS